jgi:hypothetical protein
MDRTASYIARNNPDVKSGGTTDYVVVLQEESSISNQNEKATHLVFSHKPAAEVFKNSDLLASAKLARAEIKQQLIASGRVTNSKAEKILDNMKYNSVMLDRKGYGKDVEEVMGSTSFHFMTQALKIDTEKIRFDDTTNTLNAGLSKSRAKRGTGVFQPTAIQTGRSAASQQKNATAANTKPPHIQEASSPSPDDFVFSTFPSGLDSGESLPDTASEKNTVRSSSTSSGWRAAKPTAARPEQSATTKAMTGSSSNQKKS